jgi:hypothetical protein
MGAIVGARLVNAREGMTGMTNDQAPMTKSMTNDETQMTNGSMTDSAATPGPERSEGPDDSRRAVGHSTSQGW